VAEDVTEEMEWAAREAADKEQDRAMQVTLRMIAYRAFSERKPTPIWPW
jgi:hypothetical protein